MTQLINIDVTEDLQVNEFEDELEISNQEVLSVLEVHVTDPCVRERIHKAFSEKFKDVQIFKHLWHECPPEIFCLKFTSTISQANDLAVLVLTLCGAYRSQLYERSGNCVGYQETDGEGGYYRLFENINNIDKLRNFEVENLKKSLSALDVYYPLPDLN